MTEKKPTITPSQVNLVIQGGPPKDCDPETSRAGILAHQEVRRRIEEGQPPKCLGGIGGRSPIFEKKTSREIGPDGLELSARPDITTDGAVVEIKPRPIRDLHLLQAVIEREAAGKENAVVYGYDRGGEGEGEVVIIRGGREEMRDGVVSVCRGARRILDIQGQIDTGRGKPKRGDKTVRSVAEENRGNLIGFACEIEGMGRGGAAERKGLGFEIVHERRKFDKQVGEVLAEIKRRIR